ncbi:D-isomer-specific 2-hydroxyacid dehydrogenase [Neokomagataea tanensis NBRC 106556]|uniref:D-isomer-specific 2-hydroxyacid dehydrogenase n=2 Tax=Acetobacteraceae TaxID=433 RepID=A0ABQ0QI19_9PROT|nr:D-isomer-specific 2-hydroxyacid dehydrogenase [Neokomagataea tanensis NBRC 106556]
MMPTIESALRDAFTVHPYHSLEAVLPIAPRIQAIATGGATGVPAPLLAALPALEIIAINGVGTDAVNLNETVRRGIHVTTTPGILTDDVADLAFALLLSALRQVPTGDHFIRTRQWGKNTLPLAHKASGKRLGIFGMGHVGKAVARRAYGFDMPVSYHHTHNLHLNNAYFVPSLLELAQKNDILVLSASATPQTYHSINQNILEALGPKGLLINVSRGSLVDETALITALQNGVLGAAALDVFEHEPNVPEALLSMENVVLQPHRASATVETRLTMGQCVVDNLLAHFSGRPLISPVLPKTPSSGASTTAS